MGIAGVGRWSGTAEAREVRPSRRPRKTGKKGPPSMVRRSRVAAERMSAQETVLGQASSRAVLARTTRSKASPGRERLMSASRSAPGEGRGGEEDGGVTAVGEEAVVEEEAERGGGGGGAGDLLACDGVPYDLAELRTSVLVEVQGESRVGGAEKR
ncbi:hypothetical protein JHK87_035450 [Glycine soja]|nr:hypothetical protein JHK87_035450 [Glycine soja]